MNSALTDAFPLQTASYKYQYQYEADRTNDPVKRIYQFFINMET